MMEPEKIREIVVFIRKMYKDTQSSLARKIGEHQETISNRETGRTRILQKHLEQFCEVYGLDLALFGKIYQEWDATEDKVALIAMAREAMDEFQKRIHGFN